MKLGLIAVAFSSLVKLGLASHQRVNRHMELSSALSRENEKFLREQKRFDRLFTIGGGQRYMEDQPMGRLKNGISRFSRWAMAPVTSRLSMATKQAKSSLTNAMLEKVRISVEQTKPLHTNKHVLKLDLHIAVKKIQDM